MYTATSASTRETAASTGYLPTSILAVPVEDDDGPIGVLEVLDREPEAQEIEIAAAGRASRSAGWSGARPQPCRDATPCWPIPALSELVALVRRLADADERDRRLAAALLQAVVDQPRPAAGA